MMKSLETYTPGYTEPTLRLMLQRTAARQEVRLRKRGFVEVRLHFISPNPVCEPGPASAYSRPVVRLCTELLVASKTPVHVRNSKIELQSELDNSWVVARRGDATEIAGI